MHRPELNNLGNAIVDKIDLHRDAQCSINRTLNSRPQDCRAASGATRSLYNPLRSQTKLLLSPVLIEMADERQHTVKESKGLRNRLKKAFGLGSQPDEAAELRAKYTRFRILVIGRANAGKTTLLKRVCNTTEEPSIYDKEKNLVRYQLIMIPHSHRSFTYSSNRPRRCRLGDFCLPQTR